MFHFKSHLRHPRLSFFSVSCLQSITFVISSLDGEGLGVLVARGYHCTLRDGCGQQVRGWRGEGAEERRGGEGREEETDSPTSVVRHGVAASSFPQTIRRDKR